MKEVNFSWNRSFVAKNPIAEHWPGFTLFYWMTWPWSDDIIRPRYVRTLRRKFVSERALNVVENFFWCTAYSQGKMFKCRKIFPTGNRWNRALFAWQKTTKFRLPIKLLLLRGSRIALAAPTPNLWLTIFQISSKSVYFRRSYSTTREDRPLAP